MQMSMDRLLRSSSPSTSEDDLKALAKELGTIKELDKILEEKQTYLQLLTRERLALQRDSGSHEEITKNFKNAKEDYSSFLLTMREGPHLEEQKNENQDKENKDESTEPQAKKLPKTRESKFTVKKNYDKSDFVNRNKAIGAEARYYSTLTPKEQERVESIMTSKDDEENLINEESTEIASTSNTTTSAFALDDDDLQRIRAIHTKLRELVPRIQVIDEDLPASVSGTHTPIELQNVSVVDPGNLKSINEALTKLKEDSVSKSLTQAELNDLVMGCMREELHLQRQGRTSPSAEC